MRTRPGGGSATADPTLDAIEAYHSQTTVNTVGLFGTSIPDPFSLVTGLISGVSDVASFLKLLAWIINPANILRMVEVLLGIGLMAFGLQAAAQGVGERNEGYETGENALSRSGLGRVSKELAAAVVTRKSPAKPATAPHKTRRTALRVRYEREQQVANKKTAQRRGSRTPQTDS